jgi:adenosylhomocysteine nucleosidase
MSALLRCTQTFSPHEICLILAMPQESQNHFEKAGIEVHYSGIGKINAAHLATELILKRKPKHLLNLGTAGSHIFERGQLIECTGFVQRDLDMSLIGIPMGKNPFEKHHDLIEVPPLFPELSKGICGTGDRLEALPCQVACTLADMEAYALAKVCGKLGVGFTSVKYISDKSDDDMKEDFFSALEKAAKALVPVYQSFVR